MARMNWDRVRGEGRIRAHGRETASSERRCVDWLIRSLRRNRHEGRCPVCGDPVPAGEGWLKRRRPYHPKCLTDWS